MIFKKPEAQLSLVMSDFLLYLSATAFYWCWLEHSYGGDRPEAREDWMVGLWLLWFGGLVFIPLGQYLLVRSWQIVREEIISGS